MSSSTSSPVAVVGAGLAGSFERVLLAVPAPQAVTLLSGFVSSEAS